MGTRVIAICEAEGAEALSLQVCFEDVDVFVVCCAETVEENNRVGVCLAATAIVIMFSSFDDRTSCNEACRKNSVENSVKSHNVIEALYRIGNVLLLCSCVV
jgi:hypothetical protein